MLDGGQHVVSRCRLSDEDVPSKSLQVRLTHEGFIDKTDSTLSAVAEQVTSCGDLSDNLSFWGT